MHLPIHPAALHDLSFWLHDLSDAMQGVPVETNKTLSANDLRGPHDVVLVVASVDFTARILEGVFIVKARALEFAFKSRCFEKLTLLGREGSQLSFPVRSYLRACRLAFLCRGLCLSPKCPHASTRRQKFGPRKALLSPVSYLPS